MKLQDQVCTLEQAKRLKEFGIAQDSIWMHVDWEEPAKPNKIKASTDIGIHHHLVAKEIIEDNEGDGLDKEAYSAFTVAELGKMLPMFPDINWETYYMQDINDNKYCHCQFENKAFGAYKTEAEGRADLLIYMLENNIVAAEEVNARLTP